MIAYLIFQSATHNNLSIVFSTSVIDACLQVYEWRVQKMEAFRLEQQFSEAARLDAEQTRMVRDEKEKMHREQQKVKVFCLLCCILHICCSSHNTFGLSLADHTDFTK